MPNSREKYQPFRINQKEYFIKQKLGVDGYYAGAYLATTDDTAQDSVVIKIFHPHLVLFF